MNQFNEPWGAYRNHEHFEGTHYDFEPDDEEEMAYLLSQPLVRILDAKGNPVIANGCNDLNIDPRHAKRILDCVNAMAGIDDPAGLVKQRDELREALVELVQSAEHVYDNHFRQITGTWKLGCDISQANKLLIRIGGK